MYKHLIFVFSILFIPSHAYCADNTHERPEPIECLRLAYQSGTRIIGLPDESNKQTIVPKYNVLHSEQTDTFVIQQGNIGRLGVTPRLHQALHDKALIAQYTVKCLPLALLGSLHLQVGLPSEKNATQPILVPLSDIRVSIGHDTMRIRYQKEDLSVSPTLFKALGGRSLPG